MNMPNYASSEEVRDKKEQNKKEEVIAARPTYVANTCSLISKCSQKIQWLWSFYLYFSGQLVYVTADFSNAPPAEPKKLEKEKAVEYTGVQFAHPWGHKVCVQGIHTFQWHEWSPQYKSTVSVIVSANVYTVQIAIN